MRVFLLLLLVSVSAEASPLADYFFDGTDLKVGVTYQAGTNFRVIQKLSNGYLISPQGSGRTAFYKTKRRFYPGQIFFGNDVKCTGHFKYDSVIGYKYVPVLKDAE